MKKTMARPVAELRKDFPLLEDIIYLDNAATSRKPLKVLDAMRDYYENYNANVHRSIHSLGERATAAYEGARRILARFIGAASEREIIFTSGATESVNLAAASWCGEFLRPGDEVLLAETEHHSNLVPWQMAAARRDAVLRFVPLKEDLTPDIGGLKSMDWSKIKMAALAHVSNVLGVENDIRGLVRTAHEHDVPVLIDAAQSVPHFPVDVRELDCDFLVFSGHKMCGPMGSGVLYGKEKYLEKMPPVKGGGEMIRSVWKDRAEYNELPWKFEAGTPHVPGAIGLAAAAEYLDELGREETAARMNKLAAYAAERFTELEGLKMISPLKNNRGIFTFNYGDVHPHDIAQFLDGRNIAVRAGHHCAQPLFRILELPAGVRASLYFYNTEEEIDALTEGIIQAGEFFHV